MVPLMEKRLRNTKQVRAARDFLHCVILEQRAATEELKASNRELESLLEDLVSSRADLKSIAEDKEEPAAYRRRDPEPADRSLSRLRREINTVLEEGAAAIRDSVRLRRRARQLREALHAARPPAEAPTGTLSRREHQVLTLIVQGKTSKKIAAELGISFKTAVTHRASIMSKLDVHEIASVVREAIRRGLV
jgi:DNA-binding NarL/FixJ family response regulator